MACISCSMQPASVAPIIRATGLAIVEKNATPPPRGKTYIVHSGDTLLRIAAHTGCDWHHLAQQNQLSPPYQIYTGQVLHIADSPDKKIPPHPKRKFQLAFTNHYCSNRSHPVQKKKKTLELNWQWPTTKGKVIRAVSTADGSNQGIDIIGEGGEPIYSAAAGRIVYVGNALRGYGNLIIIKHNKDYLTAYAHNDSCIVQEQQEVMKGQQIATMGSTGTHTVQLHFEIRYKGKSVDPVRYLPPRITTTQRTLRDSS